MEWMHGGGRDPNGRSLDDEIRIGKEDWMERQRVAARWTDRASKWTTRATWTRETWVWRGG